MPANDSPYRPPIDQARTVALLGFKSFSSANTKDFAEGTPKQGASSKAAVNADAAIVATPIVLYGRRRFSRGLWGDTSHSSRPVPSFVHYRRSRDLFLASSTATISRAAPSAVGLSLSIVESFTGSKQPSSIGTGADPRTRHERG